MRKFLFVLLLLPAIASLGHDVFMFTQHPDKGFRLTDLGALWDKYHKESHDQWKIKLKEYEDQAADLTQNAKRSVENILPGKDEQSVPAQADTTPSDTQRETAGDTTEQSSQQPANAYEEEFTQLSGNEKSARKAMAARSSNDMTPRRPSTLQKAVGFVLEQKAVFVFTAIAVFAFLLNALLSPLFKEKESMDKVRSYKKHKHGKKGGGYQYSRK